MERTGLTMALLQILLLLLYALPLHSLPITSNPLGLEDTPDNLAYHTQALEGRSEGVRKIPKSIFITPNHPDFQMSCPTGYQLKDGICTKISNFEVNHLALITAQFQQILDKTPTTSDYDEYDYDNYGDVTESAEPYHVPLSVSFDDEPPARDKYSDGIQNLPFLANDFASSEETSQRKPPATGPPSKSTDQPTYDNVVPNVATVAPNVDERPDVNVANDKDSTRTEPDIDPTTASDIVATTPDESLLLTPDPGTSTTQKKVLTDMSDYLLTQKEEEHITEKRLDSTATIGGDELATYAQHTDQESAENHMVQHHIEATTPSDDQNILDRELQSESLFKDDSLTGTSQTVSDGTTEMIENDIEVTTVPLNSLDDRVVNSVNSISTPALSIESSSKIEHPVVVVPTVEQVQIVTPVQQTTTSHSTAHHDQSITTHKQSTPSSTQHTSELQTAEHLDINESMMNKKLRESVMKHELNEDAIDTIDTNNRFVYTHLDSTSNEPEDPPSPSSSSSTTEQPTVTEQSPLEQLRFFNDDARIRNNRIRFPEQPAAPLNIFSNFKGGTIKFPGPVQQRVATEPLFNRLIPDIIPKKPPESAGDRPLFSWLPPGATFDFGRNNVNPAFMRFWNKMPLIRDRSMTNGAASASSSSSSDHQPRSNSKSPTDNLYKDAPVSEVYKVISSRNYKHDNR